MALALQRCCPLPARCGSGLGAGRFAQSRHRIGDARGVRPIFEGCGAEECVCEQTQLGSKDVGEGGIAFSVVDEVSGEVPHRLGMTALRALADGVHDVRGDEAGTDVPLERTPVPDPVPCSRRCAISAPSTVVGIGSIRRPQDGHIPLFARDPVCRRGSTPGRHGTEP
jgi:hypothetical protein